MQGGHQLVVQGQPGYQTNMDPSQYQTQGGGVVSINEHGFRSGNFEELRRNQIQQNVAQGRPRVGSGSNRDDMNLHQGQGRAIQHDGQKSLTESQVGVISNYADVQSNQLYSGRQAGQFSNQPAANQWNTPSPSNYQKYNIPQQHGNVGGIQQGVHYDKLQPVSVPGQQLPYHDPRQPVPGGAAVGQYRQRKQYNIQQQQYGGAAGGQVTVGSMNEKAALEERLERVEAQKVGLHHDKVDLQNQLQGAIKDTANLSDELMAKNQQVKQFSSSSAKQSLLVGNNYYDYCCVSPFVYV